MSNLEMWKKYCAPPPKALKKIQAGRLKGMSDINPQWRLLALTEMFGPCGKGWYTEIASVHTERMEDGTAVASVIVKLFYREKSGDGNYGEWSEPVYGIGGSMLVASEKAGLRTSDEAFKMAETDAISVCCKKLGIAADVYLGQMDTKYYTADGQTSGPPAPPEELSADDAAALINNVMKLGAACTNTKSFAAMWRDNMAQIAKLPLGQKADLSAWKDERKAELAK